MPRAYWTYALATAVYLINRMPTPILSNKLPFECIFMRTPNYSKLRIFVCLCFPWLKPYTSPKLDSRSISCIFLGYSTTQSAYYCLDRATSRIYTSRHVVFHQYVYPFALPNPLTSDSVKENCDAETMQVQSPSVLFIFQQSSVPSVSTPSPLATEVLPHSTQPHSTPPTATTLAQPNKAPSTAAPSAPPPINQQPQQATTLPTTAPTTTKTTSSPAQEVRPPPQPTRASQRQRKPVTKLNLSAVSAPMSDKIPTSVAEALKDPRWRQAMIDEINAQLRNHT